MTEPGAVSNEPEKPEEELSEEIIIKRRKRRQDRRLTQATKVAKIKARDGNECYLCNMPLTEEDMTMEHLIPKSKGGSSRIDNLKLAHGRCNVLKGDRLIEELELPFVWDEDS